MRLENNCSSVPSILTDSLFNAIVVHNSNRFTSMFLHIKNEAKEIFAGMNGSHGWDHAERVYNLSMHIGRKERADLEILGLAAILHDIGRIDQDKSNGKVCHAKRGAYLAMSILEKYSADKKLMYEIFHCIETHRYRGEKLPKTKEAKVLFDADKLDSIGAVGIGRAFLFAGEIGARLHNDVGVDINKTKPYTKDDTAFREFTVKLKKIKDKMLTNEGRRLAENRHAFMVAFFQRLDNEIRGDI